jgi:ankyrin repeat protein
VRLLLDRGADPSLGDRKLRTPLHVAAKQGDPAAVGLLVDRGADPWRVDEDGYTPLHVVACDEEVVRKLLWAGAEPDVRTGRGFTVLHFLVKRGCEAPLVRLVVERSAPDRRSTHGDTALHRAGSSLDGVRPEVVELLVDRGWAVDAVDGHGATPLHYVDDAGAAAVLLAHAADPGAKDRYGWTPLHFAALVDAADVIEALRAHGASTAARSTRERIYDDRHPVGSTPADVARREGSTAALAALTGSD